MTETAVILGADLGRGERPQHTVPAGAWQSARSRGEWSLVGCTVSPAFTFERFELAPPGWAPGVATGVSFGTGHPGGDDDDE